MGCVSVRPVGEAVRAHRAPAGVPRHPTAERCVLAATDEPHPSGRASVPRWPWWTVRQATMRRVCIDAVWAGL